MKTGKFLLAALIGIIGLAACNKNQRSNHLSYYETQCADPWVHHPDENIHKNNILQYLSANDVNASGIDLVFDQDSAMACLACICLSGTRVDINVPDEDVAEANALGFN